MNEVKKVSFFKIFFEKLKSVVYANVFANCFRGLFGVFFYLIIVELTLPVVLNQSFDFLKLGFYAGVYVLLNVFYIGFVILAQKKSYVQTYQISSSLRIRIADKLRSLPISFFKKNNPQKVASSILEQVQKAELILSRSLPEIIAGVVVPFILFIFLVFINFKIAFVLFLFVCLAVLFLVIANFMVRVLGERHVESIEKVTVNILDYFRNIKLIKSYNQVDFKFDSMKKSFLDLNRMTFKTETFAGIPMQVFLLVLEIGYLVSFFYAFFLFFNGFVGVLDLIAFAVIGFYFFEPVKVLGGLFVELSYARISIKKIDSLLNLEEQKSGREVCEKNCFDVEFENVSFGYLDKKVLKNVSVKFPFRSMTALVGKSGSGKSTLTSLIARFWDVDFGVVRVGGVDVRDLGPEVLLSQVSMIFQEVFVFSDSVLNNVRIGNSNASFDEVVRACKLAMCDEFIRKLPLGYDTVIGEGACSLSGGQLQRISIARAILKDAPIVVFDEATASLDPENEGLIQKAIENLVKDKTLIVIAHKFKSIENADNILVLDDGCICELGTHLNLVEKRGVYYNLWKKQQEIKGWKLE